MFCSENIQTHRQKNVWLENLYLSENSILDYAASYFSLKPFLPLNPLQNCLYHSFWVGVAFF